MNDLVLVFNAVYDYAHDNVWFLPVVIATLVVFGRHLNHAVYLVLSTLLLPVNLVLANLNKRLVRLNSRMKDLNK